MTDSQPPQMGNSEPPAEAESDNETSSLVQDVERIREEFERSQQELAEIAHAGRGEVLAADLVQRRRELEDRAGTLLVRYVIGQRLASSPEFSGVMRALEEVLEGMVGLARFKVYWRGGEQNDFVLCMEFPDKGEDLGYATLASTGTIANAAEQGQRLVLSNDEQRVAGPDAPLCWFPMHTGERPIGGIAVFEVLPHKKYLGPSDLELLEMISDHAADAIAAADAYSRKKFNLKSFAEVIAHGKRPPRA